MSSTPSPHTHMLWNDARSSDGSSPEESVSVLSPPDTPSQESYIKQILRRKTRKSRSPSSHKDRDKSSSGFHQHHLTFDGHFAESLLRGILEEEEKQGQNLKIVLRNTNEILEKEIIKAEQAEQRAEVQASIAKAERAKTTQAEQARRQMEVERDRSGEEVNRYKLQMEAMGRDLQRAEKELRRSEELRIEAEQDSKKYRELAKDFEQQLRENVARQEGREEGKRVGRSKGYEDGQLDGWRIGRFEGFQEGRTIGHHKGREEGEEEGRELERKRALEAFDDYLSKTATMTNDYGSNASGTRHQDYIQEVKYPPSLISTNQRTRRWAEETARQAVGRPDSPDIRSVMTSPRQERYHRPLRE